MIDDLLPHYERELALLRRSLQSFAERYPKVAARLAISGEHSEDPHVERMLQSFALLAARIDIKLDDDFPEFTEALLASLYPECLRPFPSCSIAQFDIGNLFQQLTEPKTIARGTRFSTHIDQYSFVSTHDVVLAPVRIADARYALPTSAPRRVTLSPDTTGLLSITFAPAGESATLKSTPAQMRIHLSGSREFVAALRDGFLLRATDAFVAPDESEQWRRLAETPISAVGFEETDMLLGARADTVASPLRLFTEYLVFPQRFDFIDINLAALREAAGPCRQLTLHLAIVGIHPDSRPAQQLIKLAAANMKLFCTPVVNRFVCQATHIELRDGISRYPLVPKVPDVAATEVWSIDRVRLTKSNVTNQTEIHPFHSLLHGSTRPNGSYWSVNRNDWGAHHPPGYETKLDLVGPDGGPSTLAVGELGIDITCTNGNRPASLPVGAPGGDLEIVGEDLLCPIVLLRRPTQYARPSQGDGARWRIISHLTHQSVRLTKTGLDELRQLFRQLAAVADTRIRHIEGITGLNHRLTMQWIDMAPQPAFARGMEVTVTLDEQAFVDSSLDLFTRVLDRFFAPYAPTSSFIQLVVVSAGTGTVIRRCPPRAGIMPLV